MLPINHRSIFRSRWVALLWAAGIIWSAVGFVGSGSDHGEETRDVGALANALD